MTTVAVIGLGYVGLPLVVEFGKRIRTIGFDIAESKVAACQRGTDPSRELPDEALAEATHALYTSDGAMLAEADIVIVGAHPGGRGPHPRLQAAGRRVHQCRPPHEEGRHRGL